MSSPSTSRNSTTPRRRTSRILAPDPGVRAQHDAAAHYSLSGGLCVPLCTSIAFKPIRLSCGHLFCVRCLVKMQKRGNDHCPMCRAPCVLVADGSNVDWAMLNFMHDWFPEESSIKLRQNEKEATEEELRDGYRSR
ncbi:Transcriptional regulator of yeast-form-adherence 3 [Mycena sanguinolenta]|uniref:Transcriptional regulator of yeast-form-adherence 3 n=1 Tax=Mycena sanguinolenta TaxID=230812 RepID=A0A8H6Z5A8_9AGAR|nr:Transcriptional regulator of yeast-form-adherence 3 [Mycena sanguinolenta]